MHAHARSRLLTFWVLGLGMAAALNPKQPEWHVDSLKASIVVNADSSLLVDETLVVPDGPDPNFGLRCEIPIGDNDRWDRSYGPGYTDDNGLRFKVQKVTVDGLPAKSHIDHYRRSEYQLIVDGQHEPGSHELNVVYRVTGGIRAIGNEDELYWNVAGHMLPITYGATSVRVSLPSEVPGESVQISSFAGNRGYMTRRFASDPAIENTKLSDGAEFSVLDLHSHQSLSIVMRWPQGYVARSSGERRYGSPYFLGPLLLIAIYITARFYLRRNVQTYSTAPQYDPPGGLSPAALRYVVRGVVDGTSIAASLANLAAHGYIEAQAKGSSFGFWRTQKCDTDLSKLPTEEAALADLLFDPDANVADATCGTTNDFLSLSALNLAPATSGKRYATVVAFGPSDPRINVLVGAVSLRLKPQLDGKYFTWNAWIVVLGMLATLIFGVTGFLQADGANSPLFLAIWSFFIVQIFSSIVGVKLLGGQRKPLVVCVVGLVFAGLVFLALRKLAQDISWTPVASYFAMMVVNGIFVPLLRTPTAEGQKLLVQIQGYRMFLQETELDRLQQLGKSASMPKLAALPYVIALDLREPWGDAMTDTFSTAMTSV
jgi:hypothetical protein